MISFSETESNSIRIQFQQDQIKVYHNNAQLVGEYPLSIVQNDIYKFNFIFSNSSLKLFIFENHQIHEQIFNINNNNNIFKFHSIQFIQSDSDLLISNFKFCQRKNPLQQHQIEKRSTCSSPSFSSLNSQVFFNGFVYAIRSFNGKKNKQIISNLKN